ncbi:hypothetical protein V5O48_006498, partial [Marasmius crinis-equi]
MFFLTALNDLRPKPPTKINPDRLGLRDEKALKALNVLADAMKLEGSTCQFVEDNWVALCRGVLDRPPPVTQEGTEVVSQLLTIGPFFFNYPLQKSGADSRCELKSLLSSTPHVLALAAEMWLHRYTIEHPNINQLANAVGLLLEVHNGNDNDATRVFLLQGEATNAFSDVIHDTKRWPDIPSICVKGIMWQLSQPRIDFDTLGNNLIILSTIGHGIPGYEHMDQLLSEDGVRWTCSVVAKLSSLKPKHIRTSEGDFDDFKVSFTESINFLFFAAYHDVHHVSEALDRDILVSICKAHELIVEDCHRHEQEGFGDSEPESVSPLQSNLVMFLLRVTAALVHRSVLLRAFRNLKKIERLGVDLDLDGSDPRIAECAPKLHESWVKLKAEISRRHVIKSSMEHYVGEYEYQGCGCENCPNALDARTCKYLRCSGCLKDAYCSAECQRKAWKQPEWPHSELCKEKQALIRGGHTREPGDLDLAAMRKQLSFDVLANTDDMNRLRDRFPRFSSLSPSPNRESSSGWTTANTPLPWRQYPYRRRSGDSWIGPTAVTEVL